MVGNLRFEIGYCASTGRRIPVVHMLWEHVDWVRFPAARTKPVYQKTLTRSERCWESNRKGVGGTLVSPPAWPKPLRRGEGPWRRAAIRLLLRKQPESVENRPRVAEALAEELDSQGGAKRRRSIPTSSASRNFAQKIPRYQFF